MKHSPLRFKLSNSVKILLRFLFILLSLPAWLNAQHTFEEKSDPGGLFSSTNQTFDSNSSLTTRTISLNYKSYAFTHWTINGTRQNDANGQALHKVQFNLLVNTVAIAHYLDQTIDSDQDDIPDWQEIKTSGNLEQNALSDLDGDGFPLADEVRLGLNPSVKNNITEGGISLRRSPKVFVNLGGARKLTIRSDPAGIVSSQLTYPEVNSTYASSSLNGLKNGYYFSHWEVNGVRQADSSGVGMGMTSQTMDIDKQIVAKYYAQDLDSDTDGIPDWYEWHEFGNLNHNGHSDTDGDGFSLSEEIKFGLSGVIKDNITEGGISMRRSRKLTVNLGGASKLTVVSDPRGLVPSEITFPEKNSTFTSSSINGLSNGYYFSHWEINGIRQADTQGVALGQVTEVLNEDKNIVAKYFEQNLDSDSDGIPDWYEWHEFGNLTHEGSSDPDGDGFSIADERKFGLSGVIKDNITEGGISSRRASTLSYVRDSNDPTDSDGDGLTDTQEIQLGTNTRKTDTDGDGFSDLQEGIDGTDPLLSSSFRNVAPNRIFAQSNLSIEENKPIGTLVGNLLNNDPNDPTSSGTYSYVFVDANGSNDNSKFTLETNGTLSSNQVFDYEPLAELNATDLSIRVRVSDSENLFFDSNVTISIINVVEDFNLPPSSLDLNGTTILENQPIGSLVGKFSATDPDANSTFSFKLIEGNETNQNQLFSIDQEGSLRTKSIFDFETNVSPFSIHVQVQDEFNASLENTFILLLLDTNPPFVQTLQSTILTEQKITLQATVEQNNDLPIISSGFQLSESTLFTDFTSWDNPHGNESNFSVEIPLSELKAENKYFFRAFAQNAEGISLGSMQSFITTPLPTTSEPWWNTDSEIAGGWRNSPWFGTFLPYPQGWIYHIDLGWLFTHSGETGDLWLWSNELGWLWSGPGVYPYLFHLSTAHWLYFLAKREGKPLFYDYNTKSIK